jgi:hypothetical protein
MLRRITLLIVILLITALLYGCNTSSNSSNEVNALKQEIKDKEEIITSLQWELNESMSKVKELEEEISILQSSSNQSSLLITAMEVVELLKIKDMNSLSNYIHPVKGVRFTPYSFVKLNSNLVFTSQQIINLMQNSQIYTWGEFDGSGDPIQKTFGDYYDLFVYDQDYSNPHMIGNNIEIGTGNSINNIPQAYPDGLYIEFHFTGFDPQFFGLDWRSLRIVFENVNGTWYLVGIVHNQWTI